MSHSDPAQVVIVDDHPVMRMGLTHLIGTAADFEVCGEASSSSEAIGLVESLERVDLVIVDLSLPDRNGLELIKDLRTIREGVKCLAISSHDENVYAERVLRAGGRGYIMKNQASDLLIEAIRKVLAGGYFASVEVTQKLVASLSGGNSTGRVANLSDRELEVYRAIGEGNGSREIAGALGISIRTVDAHRTHIKEKLGLPDATALTHHAICWVESQS